MASEDPPQDPHDWSPEALLGKNLGGRILIKEYQGGGGMGWVYSAHHKILGKTVAVKVLKQPNKPLLAERFFREARISSRVNHPNVVQVYDLGQEEQGKLLYLVMEFLEGESLAHRMGRHQQMSESAIAEIMSQVLAALASAHDENVIHRDLKPGNVMLTKKMSDDGELIDFVKLLDFGLAKLSVDEEEGLTRKGAVVGTPAYMSPEQVIDGRLDGRSDLYSCGVIMYEMVTGRLPFTLTEPNDVMLWHVNEVPPAPSSFNTTISADLEFVIMWAMEKRPELRCPSARELRDALKPLLPKVDPFELRTVIDLNKLRRNVAQGPGAGQLSADPKTEELDIVTIGLQSDGDHSHTSMELVSALTKSTPAGVTPPAEMPAMVIDATHEIADPATRAASDVRVKETALYLKEQYGIVYSGLPSSHPFWVRDHRGEALGPLQYDQAMLVLVRLLLEGVGGEAWLSANAVSWVKAEQFVKLTAQEALLDREARGRRLPKKLEQRSQLSQRSAVSMLSRVERQRLTGRAIFFDANSDARIEVEAVAGRMTFVYTNDLSLQLPALLAQMNVVTEENLFGLVHAALLKEVPLEVLIGQEIEPAKLRKMVLKERFRRLLSFSEGVSAFDEDYWPQHGEPVLGSLLSYLPRLLAIGPEMGKLKERLTAKMGRPIISIEAPGDDLGPEERALIERLPYVSRLGEALSGGADGVVNLELATIYVLLESEQLVVG